jgi:L-iditol 2-dehydrogenase
VDSPAVGDLVTGRLVNSYADLIVARAQDAVIVPDCLTPDSAIGEPLGCIVHAVRRSHIDIGDRVAVIGVGFMGLCLLQLLAARRDTAELAAIDTRPEARRHGLQHGATRIYTPDEALETPGMLDAFDVVFEVTGAQAGLDLATALIKPHGTLSILGYHQSRREIDMQSWNWKSIDVVNGHVRDPRQLASSTKDGLVVVATRQLTYRSLITHRYPLSGIDQAFRDLRTKPEGFIKAVIDLTDPDQPTAQAGS